MNSIHLCFRCRFCWLAEGDETAPCPKCRSDQTTATTDLAFIKSHVFREQFPEVLVRAMEDPDLAKLNKPFMKEYWAFKKSA